jgi:hypothetical protein
MYTIETSVDIAAPPECVWGVLVGLAEYAEWNPFMPYAEGEVTAGRTIKVLIRPPGDEGMVHQPTIVVAEPGKRLQWLGKVAVPGLFSACHEFVLEPVTTGTRLRHREEFTGVLVPFLRGTLRRTEEDFHAMNRALKDRADCAGGNRDGGVTPGHPAAG